MKMKKMEGTSGLVFLGVIAFVVLVWGFGIWYTISLFWYLMSPVTFLAKAVCLAIILFYFGTVTAFWFWVSVITVPIAALVISKLLKL